MKVLIDAVYRAVKELYDHTKPWGVDFLKFTIDFDETGRIAEVFYTIPGGHQAVLVECVRQAGYSVAAPRCLYLSTTL